MNINRNTPFLPLSPNTGATNSETTHDNSKEYVLSLSSYQNPAVFYFDDVFEHIKSIEVLKSRIERSEKTCEYYRNCPFITLFNNFPSFVNSNTVSNITNQLGMSEMNMTADGLMTLLNDSLANYTAKSFPCSRKFQYNYSISSLSTMWWQSPEQWDSYINNWYLSNLWGCFDVGIAPYVLDIENYSIDTLVSTLNDITNAYYYQMQDQAPLIVTAYNSDLNRLYFYSEVVFFLFPSNACDVIGLREDSVYVAQFNYTTNNFMVYADHPPKLTGSDVVYIQNDESQPSFKNPTYSSLSTVYLPDNSFYPYLNTGTTNSTIRPVQMINKRINKLTISMYSDITNKFLYQNNDTKWYIDLLVKGII